MTSSTVAVACDICHVLTENSKIGTPEYPETDRRYGPILCPDCFKVWESDAAEKAVIEDCGLDYDVADYGVYDAYGNPDDGRMCHDSEWERGRGYFAEIDSDYY